MATTLSKKQEYVLTREQFEKLKAADQLITGAIYHITDDPTAQDIIDGIEIAKYATYAEGDILDTNSNPISIADRLADIEAEAESNNSDLQSQINTNRENLANEVSRAQSAESTLQTNINTEASTRKSADDDLQSQITTEIADRQNADNTLQSNIDSEANTRLTNDNTLQTNIDNEAQTREDNDNSIIASIGATEDSITTDTVYGYVNKKVSELESADSSNLSELTTLINNEASTREANDNTIQTNLDDEITRATLAENSIQDNLDAEIERAQAAESTLQSNIDSEASTRESTDNDLQSQIDALTGSVTSDYSLIKDTGYTVDLSIDSSTYLMTLNLKNINGTVLSTTSVDFPIESMVINGTYDNGILTLKLQGYVEGGTDEENAGKIIEIDISSIIDGLVNDTDFNALESRVTSAENDIITNASNISTNAANIATNKTNIATNASDIATLRSDLTTETSNRESADNTLQDNIDAEVDRATSAESTLQSNIDIEASTRSSADTTLQTNIDSEVSRAEEAEKDLQDQITANDSDISTLTTNLNTEITNRTTADNTLQTNIDNEAATRESEDSSLQDQITSNDSDILTLQNNLSTEISDRKEADTSINSLIGFSSIDSDGNTTYSSGIDSTTTVYSYINSQISNVTGNGSGTSLSDLQDQITSNDGDIATLQSDLSDEVTNRTNADSDLQDQIDSLDESVVHKATEETITDNKTFTKEIIFNQVVDDADNTTSFIKFTDSTGNEIDRITADSTGIVTNNYTLYESNLEPITDSYSNLGDSDRRWKDLYIVGNLIDSTSADGHQVSVSELKSAVDQAHTHGSTIDEIDTAVANTHTHDNKDILDAITASYTTEEAETVVALKEKLDANAFGLVDDVQVAITDKATSSIVADKIATLNIGTATFTTTANEVVSSNFTEDIKFHEVSKTGAYSDLIGTPTIVDDLTSDDSSAVLSAKQGKELLSLINNIERSYSFDTLSDMVSALNSASDSDYVNNSNIYILDLEVPDVWIVEISDTSSSYTYSSDTELINELETNGTVQIGYYTISLLETAKVDLSNYVTLDGTETITGVKTFNNAINLTGTIYANDSSYPLLLENNNYVYVGNENESLVLRGTSERPYYNITTQSNAVYLALYSDIPQSVSELLNDSDYAVRSEVTQCIFRTYEEVSA